MRPRGSFGFFKSAERADLRGGEAQSRACPIVTDPLALTCQAVSWSGRQLLHLPQRHRSDIEAQTGYRMQWHILDLSGVEDNTKQVKLIRAWGRVGVKLGLDLPPFRMN